MSDAPIRPLNVPLLCWHESTCSARTDPLVALAQDAGFIATDRPVPVGTPVFLELALGHASNAARAQIDAVVVSADAPVEMAGFVVRFVDVDSAVLTWIDRHLQSAAQKKAAAQPAMASAPPAPPSPEPRPEPAPAPAAPTATAVSRREASLPRRLPPPLRAPLADDAWGMPPSTAASAFAPASRAVPPARAAQALPAPPGARVIAGLEELDELPEVADFAELDDADFEPLAASPAVTAAPLASAPAAVMLPNAVSFDGVAAPTDEPPLDVDLDVGDASAQAAGFFDAADEAALTQASDDEPPAPSLDLQVAAALGELPELPDLPEGDDVAAMDEAFGGTFSPWGEAPEGALTAQDDPFALDLPDVGESLELADSDDPPAPPAPASAEGAPLSDLSWDAAPLASAHEAKPPAPLAADESFDPFADDEAAPGVLPEAAAPLVSDQFVEKADESSDDDLDVDVFDDAAGPGQAFEPPPLRARDDLPGLADAGVGFSNPFARAARGQSDDEAAPDAPGTDAESVTPTFGTRQAPLAEAPSWASAKPSPASFDGTAPYPLAEGPSGSGTQRFGVAPGGAPIGGGFPGSEAGSDPFPTPAPAPAAVIAAPPASDGFPQRAPVASATTFPDTERYSLAPGGPAVRAPAPTLDEPADASARRTPTLEFPQPGPPSSPVPPPSHTPTLREFAAVNPPGPALTSGNLRAPAAPPRMPAVSGFEEDDVVEVSTTSQIVRAGEGGLSALLAKDKAARFDLPVQSVTGGPGTMTVESEAFREPSRELDPFATFRPETPAPPPQAAAPAPPASPLTAPSQQAVWFPGEPQRAPDDGPPTGVFGPAGRPAEAWQVPPPSYASARGEPEELPVVTGITVLEELAEEELPLVQALPLDEEAPPRAPEPWVVGGPGRDPKR